MTDYSIPRDRYGRPMLFPPEGGERVGYSRPSTLGKALDSGKFLVPYNQTIVAIGLARNKWLFAKLKALVAKGATWQSNKSDFTHLVEQAHVAGGGEEMADRGTTVHDLCEAAETGWLDWDLVEEDLVPVIKAYEEQIVPDLKVVARECFVAVDKKLILPDGTEHIVRAAGSIDRVGECSDGKRRIIDIKTGRDNEFRLGVKGQTTLYAWGELYRDDIVQSNGNIDWADWQDNADGTAQRASLDVELDYAIMLHAPKFAKRGKWEWGIYKVPLSEDLIRCGAWAEQLKKIPPYERISL